MSSTGKMLGLDASVVPITYRLQVYAGAELIAENTHACLPSEIDAAAVRVAEAFEPFYPTQSVTVQHWQA